MTSFSSSSSFFSSLTSSTISSLTSSGVLPSSFPSWISSLISSLTSSLTSSFFVTSASLPHSLSTFSSVVSSAHLAFGSSFMTGCSVFGSEFIATTVSLMSETNSSFVSVISISSLIGCVSESSTGAELTIGSILPACDGLLVNATEVMCIGSFVSLFKYHDGDSQRNTLFSINLRPMSVHFILPKRPTPGMNFNPDSHPLASVFPPISDSWSASTSNSSSLCFSASAIRDCSVRFCSTGSPFAPVPTTVPIVAIWTSLSPLSIVSFSSFISVSPLSALLMAQALFV